MRFALLYIAGIVLLHGCNSDESPDSLSLIVEIPSPIRSTKLIAKENKVYIVTYLDLDSQLQTTTDVYRVDLQNSNSTKITTTEGSCDDGFVVSSDEKFAILSTYIQKSNGYETRIEMIDLADQTTEILISSNNTFYSVYTLDPENKFLLYNRYGNGINTIRRRNLLTDEDVQISGSENAVYVGLHPITNEILVTTYSQFYLMDWDGIIKTEPVSGFTPMSISSNGTLILCKKQGEIYTYDITNKLETQITNAGDNLNPYCFSSDGTSILFSTDKDYAIDSYLYELYTMDISGANDKRLTNDADADFPIGFFEQDTKILFTSSKNVKALYAIRR